MIGLENGKIKFEDYNSEYKKIAEETITELKRIIGNHVIKIEHIGSTAIPTIKSKPIIDIAIGVTSLEIVEEIKDILEQNNFKFYRMKVNNTVASFVREQNNIRTHNIHFTVYGSQKWKDFVWFKDYLNIHLEVAKEYEALKLMLAEKYPDNRQEYDRNKTEFRERVMEKAKQEFKVK